MSARNSQLPAICAFAALAVLLALWLIMRSDHSDGGADDSTSSLSEGERLDARRHSTSGGDDNSRIRYRPAPPISTRAENFPHNLKAFRAWEKLSVEQLRSYRVSLISRVGRWGAADVGEFFFDSDSRFEDEEAQRLFRESILGVWCAKDVEECLAQLDERFEDADSAAAKRDALAGWAREDWIPALRFMRGRGDGEIEAQLGGDSSRFVKNLIVEVARANGVEEAAEVALTLQTEKNRTVGNSTIVEIREGKLAL